MTDAEINARFTKLLGQSDKNYDALLASYESELLKQYKRALDDIRLKIAQMYEKYGDKVQYSDMSSYNRLLNLEKEIAVRIKALTKEGISTVTSGLKDVFTESYYYTGFSAESATLLKLGFGIVPDKVIQGSLVNPLDVENWTQRFGVNQTKFTNLIRSELTQGLLQGHGYSKVARKITERTNEAAYKARRIIRTESHRVYSAARQLGFDKVETAADNLGFKVRREWHSTLDERTRESHQSMDGQHPDENGFYKFPSGGKTSGPGLSGIPEEDINCRCTEITAISGFEIGKRKDNVSKELISYKTFEQWKNGRIK